MDRTSFFEKVEGKKLSITTKMFHVETEPIRISLEGEFEWDNNTVSFNWDAIEKIEEFEDGAFSFWDTGCEVIIVAR